MLSFALPKGRLLGPALARLRAAGLTLPDAGALDRKLIWQDETSRVILAKPMDVPTLVRFGAADLGICGSDVLDEDGEGLAQPLGLAIGRCRLALAAAADGPVHSVEDCHGRRIASKYPVATRRFFVARDVEVQVIELHGSVEIGPLTGLSDAIVDLVESGRTLKENGLVELETVAPVEARLVASRAALKLKQLETARLINALRELIAAERTP